MTKIEFKADVTVRVSRTFMRKDLSCQSFHFRWLTINITSENNFATAWNFNEHSLVGIHFVEKKFEARTLKFNQNWYRRLRYLQIVCSARMHATASLRDTYIAPFKFETIFDNN